jgi:hypothetical protein
MIVRNPRLDVDRVIDLGLIVRLAAHDRPFARGRVLDGLPPNLAPKQASDHPFSATC